MDLNVSFESLIVELEDRINRLELGAMAAEGAARNPLLAAQTADNQQVLDEIRTTLAKVQAATDSLKEACCQQQTCSFRIVDR